MKLTDLKPDPHNARAHTERNVALIGESLEAVGAGRSLVIDEEGRILAGNATREAALERGFADVLVVEPQPGQLVAVQRSDLTDEQKELLALYDNRTAELAAWNMAELQAKADALDLSGLFTGEEWERLVGEMEQPPPEAPEEFRSYDETLETEYCCPKCGYEWSGKPR